MWDGRLKQTTRIVIVMTKMLISLHGGRWLGGGLFRSQRMP